MNSTIKGQKRGPIPMSLRIAIALPVALLLFSTAALPQLTRGFISGTVQDSSGGVIEGVSIAITNIDTGLLRSTSTNSAGVYRFAAVEPGVYAAEFSKT